MQRALATIALAGILACSGSDATNPVVTVDGDPTTPMIDAGGTPPAPEIDAGGPPAPEIDAGGPPPPPPEIDAAPPAMGTTCEGATRLAVDADPAALGPWPVGARTAIVGRLTVEVFYPAALGSESGHSPIRYDLRQALPPSQRDKIPDEDNPWLVCDCYRDLPLDEARGPYPVIFFAHGTAAFRTQSLTQLTHWASRGHVVISADHPGLMLGDMLAMACPDEPSGSQDLGGDFTALFAAAGALDGPLSFVAHRLDLDRIGLAGHSAGGSAVAQLAGTSGVRAVIPMAANRAVPAASDLQARLFMGAERDSVVAYDNNKSAYEGSATPKQFVGIENSGHLVFSDICETTNAAGKNLVEIANQYGICGAFLGGFLFDCNPEFLDPATAKPIVSYTTTAVFERALHCVEDPGAFSDIQTRYPAIIEYLEE